MSTRKPSKPVETATEPITLTDTPAPAPLGIPEPKAYVSKLSLKCEAIVPTEQYAGIRPEISVEFTVPQGATEPNPSEILADLYHQLAVSIVPAVKQQIFPINIQSALTKDDPMAAVVAAFMTQSPLFRWLRTIDRSLSNGVVVTVIQYYEKQREQAAAKSAQPKASAPVKSATKPTKPADEIPFDFEDDGEDESFRYADVKF